MADSSKFYGKFAQHLLKGDVDLDTASVVAVLCASGYTPNQDTHEYLSSITNELVGGGYARVTLTGVVLSYDATTNTVKVTSDPFTFPALTGTFRHIVYAVSSGSDATSPLMKVTSYDVDKFVSGSDVIVTPHANGLGGLAAA